MPRHSTLPTPTLIVNAAKSNSGEISDATDKDDQSYYQDDKLSDESYEYDEWDYLYDEIDYEKQKDKRNKTDKRDYDKW